MNFPYSAIVPALSLLLIAPSLAAFQPPTTVVEVSHSQLSPIQALERFFRTNKTSADWFTAEFLAAVPLTKIEPLIAGLKQDLGSFQSVQPASDGFTIQFSQGTVSAKIVLTAEGKISGLFFGVPTPKSANLEAAIAQFKTLPGNVSVLVREGKTLRASLNPTASLGVGSAFKLAVLQALKSQITARKLAWETVIPLRSQFKSLPSGRLHTWADGSVLTVQSLAAMMISESDNTATDHLIQLVGRENIEALSPRNQPFLMTREFFQLKSKAQTDRLERYRRGTLSQKRAVLAELANQPLPEVSDFEGMQPSALDVEWFFTAEELCNLIDQVSDLPLMSINPGLAKPQDWQKVVYKGGSEAGVLNLTTGLQTKSGKRYCVVATWNSTQPIDKTKFFGLYTGLLDHLKK